MKLTHAFTTFKTPLKINLLVAFSAAIIANAALANTIDTVTLDSNNTLPACASDISLAQGVEFTRIFPDCGYQEGLAPVTKGGKYGFVDAKGKLVIPTTFDEAHEFSDGLALIKMNGKYGYINKNGKVIIKPNYTDAWGFWEGRAKIAQNGKYGFIDTTGKVVIKPTFAETGNWFEDGLVLVKVGSKYGYINKNGKTVIKAQFDTAKDFSEGLAAVGKKTGKTDGEGTPLYRFGYIDTSGKLVIGTKFDYVSDFVKGAAYVVDGKNAYFIDKSGKPTTMPNYDE